MRSIGFRASPTFVCYCVVEEKDGEIEIIIIDKLKVPTNLEMPFQLSFIRKQIGLIMNEHKINKAMVRDAESNARSISKPRTYIEGIIIERLADSLVSDKFCIGPMSKIAQLINRKPAEVKGYIDNENVFMNIKEWDSLHKEARESIISAFAACNI